MILNSPYVSGSLTVTGNITALGGISISGSIASASYAANAELLDGLDSSVFVLSSSFQNYSSSNDGKVAALNTFSASILSYTSSTDDKITQLNRETASLNLATASLNNATASLYAATASIYNFTSSANLRIGSLEQYTQSLNTRSASFACVTATNNFGCAQYFSNASNAISFTSTGSLYSDGGMRITKDMYVSGTAFFNNVTVFGTQSINYITSSQLNISTNIISVNTDTPAVRFGGLSVYDSGSTGLTGSILWDSENNHWIYSNPSGSGYSGGMFISGPRSAALGSEQGTTACALMMGQGGDHITSSAIFHYGNATCFYSNKYIDSSGNSCQAGTVCTPTLVVNKSNPVLYINAGNNEISTIGFTQGAVAGYGGFIKTSTGLGDRYMSFGLSAAGTNNDATEVVRIDDSGVTCFLGGVCAGGDITGKGAFNGYAGATQNLLVDWSAESQVTTLTNTNLFFGTNAQRRMTISNAGIACFACQVCAPTIIVNNCINIGTTTSLGSRLSIESCNDQAGITMYNSYDCNKWSLRTGTTGISNKGFGIVDDICNLTRIQIDGAGRVGIGTLTPGRKLEVYAVDPAFALKSSTTTGYSEFYFADSASDAIGYISYAHTTDNMVFGNSGVTRLTINGNGVANFACQVCVKERVYISGTFPSVTLDRNGTTAQSDIQWKDAGTTIWSIGTAVRAVGSNLDFYSYCTGDNVFKLSQTGIACFSSTVCTPSLVACITSAAAITIDGYSKLSFKDRGTEYGTINASRYNFGGESTLFTFQSGNCFLFLNGTNCLMFIGSNGNVGIGTAGPSYPLQIDNKCTNAGTLSSGGNLNGTAYFGAGGLVVGTQSTTGHTALFTNSSGRDILFGGWNGSTNDERMRITSGGRVGIGVTSPSYTLHTGGRGYFFATNQDAGWGMLTLDYGNGTNSNIYAIQMAEGGAINAALGFGSYGSPSNCGDLVIWTNSGGGLVERSRMYSNGAARIATMGSNNTTILQKSFSVGAGACVNVCFDIFNDIPGKGSGYVFQADMHVSGYGSAGASGLLYKASVAGYDGHHVGIGSYHKDAELVKCASGVDIKIYNPPGCSCLLGVTIYNCSGTYGHTGTFRMVLTY